MVKLSPKRKKRSLNEAPLYAQIIMYILLTLMGLACAIPFVNVLAKSFSSSSAIYEFPLMLWPHEFTTKAYEYIFSTTVLLKSFLITVWSTVVGTVLNLIFTIPPAYSLSKIKAPGHKAMLTYIVIPMLFGGGLIPYYVLMKNLGLLNNPWVLVINGLIAPGNLILMRNYFWSIPDSLIEAATIDGASEFNILSRILLPLSKPMIATIGLFCAVGHWNDYFTGFYFITDNTKWPLQVLLKSIVIDYSSLAMGDSSVDSFRQLGQIVVNPENIKAAVIIFSTVPIVLVYPFLQKHFAKGLIIGAVKQ